MAFLCNNPGENGCFSGIIVGVEMPAMTRSVAGHDGCGVRARLVALRTEFADSLACLPDFALTHFLEFGVKFLAVVRLAV